MFRAHRLAGGSLARHLLLACLCGLAACAVDDADDPESLGVPYCEHKSWNDYDQPDGATCCRDCDCNSCRHGSVCLGQLSGDYIEGSRHGYLAPGFTMCTTSCTTDADCQGKSVSAANGWTAEETWTCATQPEGRYCAAQITAPSTSSCGEPCPSGCCSTTGLTCCQPPFCSGACAGSPCCY